jgi:prohibitin 2
MDKPDIPDFFINPNKQYSFDPDDFLSKYKWTLIGLVLAFLVVPNFLILVGAGQKAVIFNRITGMESRVLDEGVQFVIPFVNQTTIYNVREISYIFSDKSERSRQGARVMGGSINTLTSDGQNISVEVTVRARPDFINLWWVHQNLGNDGNSSYVSKIITPVVRSVVREVISGYTVTAIYSEDRRVIADAISELLAKKLSKYNIYLSEFLLEEVTFSEAFQKAIEEKQKARIDLDTKDNIIIEEENKRDAIVTRAQGEAEAIRLKVDSLSRNPEYLRFRKAQVYGTRTKLLIDDKI